MIQNFLDFFQREIEARARLGETQGARHIARAVDLDNAQASVLVMVDTKPAVVRAADGDLGREGHRNDAGLVESRRTRVSPGIAVDQAFEHAVRGASLAHIHLVVANQKHGRR